ncbi:MAG: hypothetical protein LIO76_09355 [Clostridiales bacterium]|nr:hypothetical protein [Clostridiales bacterium]
MKKTGTALLLTMGLIFTASVAPLTDASVLVASASSGVSIFDAAGTASSSDASEDSDAESNESVYIIGEGLEDGEETEAAASASAQETEASSSDAVNDLLTIQNPEDYFGTTPIQVGSNDEAVYLIFKFKSAEDASRAYDEYSELLLEKFTEASTGKNWMRCFCYAGNDGVYGFYKSQAGCTIVADLLYMEEVPNELQIDISKDLTIMDLGERPATEYYMIEGSASLSDLDETSADSEDSGTANTTSTSSSTDYDIYDDDDDDSSTGLKTMCVKCHGTKKIECSNCDGKGYKEVYIQTPNYSGHSDTSTTAYEDCMKCHGTGEVTCTRCDGTGYEP